LEKVLKYVIIVFVIGFHLLFFFGVAKITLPINPDISAGILAFIGSILGGLITYFGVKITLEHGTNQKFLENSGRIIDLLDRCITELKAPFNALFILDGSNNFSEDQKNEKYKNVISRFNDILDEHYSKLKVELDYDFISILDFHKKSLSNRVFFLINVSDREKDIPEAVEKCRDIFSILLKHSDEIFLEYRRVKKRQKQILE
jgi:hypothetical protein